MLKIKAFIKKEAVFCIALLCAFVSMLFVPIDKEYIEYIDFRVLCLLFSLMAVVAAFKGAGLFKALTYWLLSRIKNGKALSVTLVMLPFVSSMFITNDVALIVFVPFTIALLYGLGYSKYIVPIVVLQTVSANLGSMATPVGNPQNLFIYSAYNLSPSEFFGVVLPLTVISFVLLVLCAVFVLPKNIKSQELQKETVTDKKTLVVFSLLFVLCLLTVFNIVHYTFTTVVVALCVVVINKKLFKEIDFMLLATFVCFFVVSENLGRIEEVREFLGELLNKSTLLTSIGASQVISNVPAAVLLSGFTDDFRSLLAGVNIGGLGTPVASLASLISLKLYLKQKDAKIASFMLCFTAFNIIGLALLTLYAVVTG